MSRTAWKKLVAAWLLYAFLHLGITWAPEPIFLLLGCPVESLFVHMKMAFFSYSLVCLGEVALRPSARRPGPLAARAVAAVLYSYLALMFWLPVPVLFGMWGSTALEVAYSCVVLVACLAVVLVVEERLGAQAEAGRGFMVAAAVVWATALLVFTVLAYKPPPLDVFEDPASHHHGE